MSRHRPANPQHHDDAPATSVNRPRPSDTGDPTNANHRCAGRFGRSTTEEIPTQEPSRKSARHRPPYYSSHLRAYTANSHVEPTQNAPGSPQQQAEDEHSSERGNPLQPRPRPYAEPVP